MPGEESLQGWVPVIDSPETLAKVIDEAFDYRGDVTLGKTDGFEIVGYLFNRGGTGENAFAEVIIAASGERVRLSYADIAGVRFMGKDMAAGQIWEAWQRRRDANAPDGVQT